MWDETVLILEDLFKNVWADKKAIELDNVMDVTVQVRTLSSSQRISLQTLSHAAR